MNGDAPIVVMTTEVLRNMIYAGSHALDDLRYVVLDEVHYLQNRYRGAVWEEVIIHLAPEVDLVCLSATVSNAEEFADWIRTVRGHTDRDHRGAPAGRAHEPLRGGGPRRSSDIHLLPTFVPGARRRAAAQPRGGAARRPRQRAGAARAAGPAAGSSAPRRAELVELLARGVDAPGDHVHLQPRRLRRRGPAVPRRRAAAHRRRRAARAAPRSPTRADAPLTDDDLDALGYDEWLSGFEAGIAAHHAGLVPPMKEAVEEAFAAGLVKVVFATETLSLGINMPARSVVIEKLSKFTGEHHEFLTPGEYTQLTGRAGRRGHRRRRLRGRLLEPVRAVRPGRRARVAPDVRAHVVVPARPTTWPTNLVARYEPETAHHLLNLSFAQYRADRDVVSLERQLERNGSCSRRQREAARRAIAATSTSTARCSHAVDARPARSGARPARSPTRSTALRPGDVLTTRRGGGRAVVLKHESGRSGGRLHGARHEPRDLPARPGRLLDAPAAPIAHFELPEAVRAAQPHVPKRAAAEALRTVRLPRRRPRTTTTAATERGRGRRSPRTRSPAARGSAST